MLWLCLSFPQLPASALGVRDGAVADQHGSQRWLITATDVSAAGTSVAAAQAVEPDLVIHPRKLEAEHDALRQLAHWLYHYGSPIASQQIDLAEPGRRPRARLWLEAGASLKLFGGFEALRHRLFVELAELGHVAQCALAPTQTGAALLAEARSGATCFDAQSLGRALASLPLNTLPWPGPILQSLRDVGLRRLSELFALPRESFARRFGQARLHELDRLRGLAAEPFAAIVPPRRYARRFELSDDVDTVEPLLFPLRRMCSELAAYLRARDSGAVAVRLVCRHAFGAATPLTLRFLAPTRDAARMFAALNERLLREPPTQPVRELSLEVDDFATPQPLQGDLLDPLGGRGLDWEQAIERLAARFGDGALWTPASVADHRPEQAYAKAIPKSRLTPLPQKSLPPPRPAFLLRRPQSIQPPLLRDAPERIESGWWDGADVTRDYYRVERDGGQAWVFRERRSGEWFLHGWFA
jgi:protein ImuB